jgi:hypothetical protein
MLMIWVLIPTVKAMAISYNWLFQWDEKHSVNGVISTYNW